MQKNKQKRLLSLLLTVVMVIGLLPMTAFAADTRIPISTVEATSTITPPVYGATIKSPSFTVTQGSPAYFLSGSSSASWVKKSGDSWESVYSGTFTEGTWRYRTQVRIDEPEGKTHVLAAPLNVRVNGELWAKNKTPEVDDTFSCDWVSSPEYTVTAPSGMPLTFTDNSGFDIPNNQSGKAITAYSVASYVSGGTKPYAFSKTSGPNWIAVSKAGQISGTPTTIGTNADLVVRVTDDVGAYEEITISVGNTIPQPSDRIPISTVEATSTIAVPVYGATIKTPSFTVTQGSPAYFLSGSSSASWVKKSGDSWESVYSGTFTEGTWRYRTQVRIDEPEGKTHVLAAPLNVRVNGELWAKNKTPEVDDTFSCDWVSSPEYTVTATPLVFADSTAYDIPAGTVGESYTASTALTASGGKLPYVFTVATAVNGLSINSENKLVHTRPTVADAKTATIKVTDDLGASKTITINIGAVTAAPETTYALTVTNGTDKTGGSPYAAGTAVSIEADPPAPGKQFKEWTTSNGGTFASATSASTTFTMPDKAVTVTATYKDAPVDKTALTAAISGANTNKTTAVVSTDGKDVDPANKWVTSAEMTAYTNAITAAQGVLDNTTATQAAVDGAVTTLGTATSTFNTAKKDGTKPAATYTVTLSGGGSGATGAGSYTKDATVNINAGSRTGYTFTGWTSLDVTITNPNNTNASFTMPAKNVTVKANWSYSGGGGGGGSSSTSTIQPTIPVADGAIQANYTASGGTAALALPNAKVDEIIAKSKGGEAVLDLSKVSGVTAAELPKTAVSAMNEAGLDVTVKLPAGSITLNKDAAASVAGQAEGSRLKLELKQVAKRSLTDEQKEAVKSNDLVLDINISSGTKKISNFDGTLSVMVSYNGPQPVAVWYLNDKGDLEKLSCTFKDGAVSFDLDHLSLYIVGQDTEEPAWVNPFTDVKEADWFYDAVNYINKAGLMTGTSETAFSPYTDTTRGMIVTILHTLEGSPMPNTTNGFTDVGADKYYTDAVAWASANKIVSGYGNSIFSPDNSITREQMAVILMNYAQYKGYDVSTRADLSKFADGEYISPWAKDAMSWANAEGLMQGSGNQLMPADNAQRCQVAAILQSFLERIAK